MEGNECTGKTTEAEHLAKMLDGRIEHFSAPKTPEEAANYWKVYLKAIMQVADNETVIFDRSWISDMVYGPVLRHTEEMTLEMANLLNIAAASKGGRVIYCCAPLKVITARWRKRGDWLIKDAKTLSSLQARYAYVMTQIKNIPVYYYNTD